ncbi:hypothetical protein CspHIS471_0404290 [Cutaneotrichosporon sp. HIS471]|nr:hypothetical protein CspHIS471_0404290 [Cutaneotrichosporon sp. HIS471]
MRFSLFTFAAIASPVASVRITRRDDIDNYIFPQECSTQCSNAIQFRDSCVAKNMEIGDDDHNNNNHNDDDDDDDDNDSDDDNAECNVCLLMAVPGMADCMTCLTGLPTKSEDTNDVLEDLHEAQGECANSTATLSGGTNQTGSGATQAGASRTPQGTGSAAAPSAPAPSTRPTSGAFPLGLSGAAVAAAVLAGVAL